MKTDKFIRESMLVKINATSIPQLKKLSQGMARRRKNVNLIHKNSANPYKRHPLSMKSFVEFGVENCKVVLIKECP